MRRVVPISVLAALAALLLTLPAFAAADEAELTQLTGTRFPAQSFVLTLPEGRSLPPGTVRVRENGQSVSRPSVIAADAVGEKGLAVVLVIDASRTMKGRAIVDALAAARAFASKRNPQQQLAVVTFNRQAEVALPLTADQSRIEAALSAPPVLDDDGTHLYDAVDTAVTLLRRARIKAGSVVALTDGADTRSRLSAGAVADRAEAAGVRIFTVGLRSRVFDRGALERLAAAGRGDFLEARSSAALGPIYAALGSRLASEYVIRYRSLARLGETAHVEVTAPGLRVTSYYAAPAVPDGPEQPSSGSGFWSSSLVLVAVSLICALLIGLAMVVLLALRPRGRSLQRRIEGFVPREVEEDERRQVGKSKVFVGAERSLEQTRWWVRFKEELEIARVEMPAVRLLAFTAIGTVFAIWVLLAITGSALAALLALGTPSVVWNVVARKADRQRKLFSDQLAENLQVIASAMRAGHSFVGALTVATEDAPEPAQSEFRRAVADEKLGVPLDESLSLIAERMRSRDLEQVVLVALLQRETGGNTAEVIDRVSETIRHRSELRRTVKTLTTQGRMARWIISLLPPGLLTAISVINPGYLDPLFTEPMGNALLVLGTVMVVTGSLIIKRIVNIEV
jgi:tight adherence protein B